LIVRVSYKFFRDYQKPNFGIQVKDNNHSLIFASNTNLNKVVPDNIKRGDEINVIFVIDNSFAAGSYFVSPAVVSDDGINIDWRDNFASFEIVSPWRSGSIVEFKHTVKVEKK
jgi:hypothetical protein